jgi:phosphopentomutase
MAALRTPNLKKINSGAKVPATPFVETVLLTPSNSANLPKARERSPKTDTFSGYLEITGLKAGTFRLAISTGEVLTGGGFSSAGITA